MKIATSQNAAAIAERAYFIYLRRVEQGLPGDEHHDWLQAVAENEVPPALPMGAKTRRESFSNSGVREKLQQAANEVQSANSKSVQSPGLAKIKGVGPKAVSDFAACGISTCAELATWKLADLDRELPKYSARARKEKWLAQAKSLAKK